MGYDLITLLICIFYLLILSFLFLKKKFIQIEQIMKKNMNLEYQLDRMKSMVQRLFIIFQHIQVS